MDYEVIHVNGHYAVYSNGKFICSADTYGEAEREIEAIESELGLEMDYIFNFI